MSIIKLSKIEKATILNATKEQDYCTIAHAKTINSLVDKYLAEWTSGFGYSWGTIIQLTEKGKELRSELLK